jgi:hypothetical protein
MTKSTGHRATSATERTREAERPADPSIGTEQGSRAHHLRSDGDRKARRFERALPMPADRHE